MRKVITHNLNGNAYQVEEPGYNALLAYLDGAEQQLQDNPDRAEIIADLEQAIAEKCRNLLGPQKTVVTSGEIDTIIGEMGPVEGDAGEPGGAQSERTQDAGGGTQSASSGPRRLYRLREGKHLEGVCAGLAAYFGVDVNLLRMIFLVGVAAGGASVIAYIIMMLVIPYAETPEEIAAAHGRGFNAQDFVNQAKERYSDFRNGPGAEWKRRAREQKEEWRRSWRRSAWNSRHWWGPAPPPPPDALAGVALPLFGLAIAALSIVWVLAVISVISTHAIFGLPLPLELPLWAAILILFVILQAVTAPLKYMRHASRYGYGNPVGGLVAMTASTLWIAFLVLGGWFAYTHSTEVHDFIHNLPRVWNDLLNR